MTDGAGKPPTSPYIGARPFRRDETIYGRAREARNLLSLLVGDRIVLLNSPSGAGKTSLIQAALIPRLEQRRFAVRPTIRVGAASPLPGGNRYLLSVMQSLEDARPAAEQLPPAELAGLTLDSYLTLRCGQGAENGQVLIFDQFEEVLTLAPTEEEARVEFFEQLGDALADQWRWALFVIRDEYVAALEHYANLVPTRFGNTFRLNLLGVEAAAEAIRGPAQSRGVSFDEGVAEELARDLAKIVAQGAESKLVELVGISVEPVQLQVVCYRLWERRFPAGAEKGQTISAEDAHALGSIDNALEEYYASGVARAATASQVGERAVRAWVDTQLISRQGFRSQVLAGNEAAFGMNEATVDGLTNRYLVREERRRGVTWLELAHDRLIAPVRANNARWFAANLSPLQRQAEIWAGQGQPASLIFRDAELAEAEAWAAANAAGLTADEQLFLESCRAERRRAEERARAARRIRNLAIGASIAAVLAVIAAFTAFGFYTDANAQRLVADQQRNTAVASQNLAQTQQALAESSSRVSKARELAAAAKTQLSVDPELSILLGLRAIGATRAGDTDVADAADALQQAVQASRTRATFQPGGAQLFTVAYSPDGKLIATAGLANTVHLLDASSGEEARALAAGANRFLIGLDFSPDGGTIIAGGDDQILYRFRVGDGEPLEPSATLGASIVAARYSPDGALIAVALRNDQVQLLDGQALTPLGEPLPFDRNAFDLAFSPDGRLLAVPAPNGVVVLWDTIDRTRSAELQQPTSNSVFAVAFSSDGALLAVGGRDQRARIWDVAGQELLHEYRGHTDSVFKVAFGPGDAYLITGSGDSTVRLWDIAGETTLRTLAGHANQVRGISLRGDGNMLASASTDTTVRQWSLGLIQGQQLRAAAYSPDGATLATAGDDGLVQLWDARSEQRLRTLRGQGGSVQTIAFSADGRSLISGGADKLALIWDVAAGGEPQRLVGHTAGVNAVAFSPGGPLAATASDDGTVRLWDTLRATEVYSFTTGAQLLTSVAFSPDGSLLAAGDGKGLVSVWDVKDHSQRTQLAEPSKSRIQSIAFSPDGAHLAVSGNDFTPYIFPLAGGEPIPLTGHAGPVNAIAFNHAGDQLASASSDDTVRFWDAASGAPAALALRSIIDPRSISFSPDDAWLAVVATRSGEANLYPLGRQALIDLAQARLTRGFTDQECAAYAISDLCP